MILSGTHLPCESTWFLQTPEAAFFFRVVKILLKIRKRFTLHIMLQKIIKSSRRPLGSFPVLSSLGARCIPLVSFWPVLYQCLNSVPLLQALLF